MSAASPSTRAKPLGDSVTLQTNQNRIGCASKLLPSVGSAYAGVRDITLMEGHSILAALGIWSTPRIRPKYSETPKIYENISKKSRSVYRNGSVEIVCKKAIASSITVLSNRVPIQSRNEWKSFSQHDAEFDSWTGVQHRESNPYGR